MQYSQSTLQSQNMDIAAQEVNLLLRNLSDSLEKLALTSSLSNKAMKQHYKEMRCHNAKMHQQLLELIKMNEKAQKLQEKAQQTLQDMHQKQMQSFQEMQEHIKQTLAKITKPEEPHPRNAHKASPQKPQGSLVINKTEANNEAFLFQCSQSSVQKKQSSSEEEDENFLQKMKIQDFIKSSHEKLEKLKLLPFKCESFLEITDKILTLSRKIELLQAKSITDSELEDLSNLRVFVKRIFVQQSRCFRDN